MRSCGKCGHACGDDESFCPQCHTYLGWTDTQTLSIPTLAGSRGTGSESAQSPVRPSDAPLRRPPDPAPDRAEVALTLSAAALAVAPGSSAATTAVVKNHGTLVDEFAIGVEGPARSWAQVEPERVAVYPGDEKAVAITFTPPRDAGVPAGETPFAVVARSVPHPGTQARESGTIDIAPVSRLEIDVVPDRQRATRSAGYHVLLRNRGNHDTLVELRPGGAHHELELLLEPERLRVPPFGTVTAGLHLQARGKGSEQSRVHVFHVEGITDEGGQESRAGTAEVVFVHEPQPPSPRYLATVVGWLVGGLLVGVLLGAVAAGAAVGIVALTTGPVSRGEGLTAGVPAGLAGGAVGLVLGSMLGIRRALRPRKAVRIGMTCLIAGILTVLWLLALVLAARAGSVPALVVLVLANPALLGRWLALRGMPEPPPEHAPAPGLAPVAGRLPPAANAQVPPGSATPRPAAVRNERAVPGVRAVPDERAVPDGRAAAVAEVAGTDRPAHRSRTAVVVVAGIVAAGVLAVLLLGLPGTTLSGLNVRSGPGVENPVNGDPLEQGALVTVRCQAGPDWVAISLPRPGYVAAGFLDYPGARPCLGGNGGL